MAKLYILPAGSNIRYMCVGLFINSVCVYVEMFYKQTCLLLNELNVSSIYITNMCVCV